MSKASLVEKRTMEILWIACFLSIIGWVVCEYHEYIVIGAGPAGLQMGYFLERAHRDYLILEKSHVPGAFFATYPRHDTLISINKRNTGQSNKEFNLRHDWNSLLSDDESLLFRQYSRDYFPHRQVLVDYLADFARKLELKIRFNTTVEHVSQEAEEAEDDGTDGGDAAGDKKMINVLEDEHGNQFTCRYLLVATGLWKPNIPNFAGVNMSTGYEDLDTDGDSYEGKSVLILGHGNAAFETANAIYPHASVVHLAGRSRIRLAWETHYVGDLRALNNNLLDTYQLKSLDGVLEGSLEAMRFHRDDTDGSISLSLHEDSTADNFALRDKYDTVLRCLGFKFDLDIFNESLGAQPGHHKISKFPLIDHNYQMKGINNIFVLGVASHSLDFRRSAGGFIHGFRYTARVLHRSLEARNHGNAWPSTRLYLMHLLPHLLKRLNEASGIYQMFSVLVDVMVLHDDNDTVDYYEEFPARLIPVMEAYMLRPVERIIVLSMQYGKDFQGQHTDVFRSNRATAYAHKAHRSNFLHPVFHYYKTMPTERSFRVADARDEGKMPEPTRLHHIVEDFLTQWMAPSVHGVPLRRFLEACTRRDLRQRTMQECYVFSLTHRYVPLACKERWMNDGGLDGGGVMEKLIGKLKKRRMGTSM